MKIIVTENYGEMSKEGAKIIAKLLKEKPDCILGLATGPPGGDVRGAYKA